MDVNNPLKMVLIGIDPYPNDVPTMAQRTHTQKKKTEWNSARKIMSKKVTPTL